MRNKLIKVLCLAVICVSCSHLNSLVPTNNESENKYFKTVWTKNLDSVSDSGNLPISLQSPLIEDGVVYVGDSLGFMNAYELSNGREVWRVNDNSEFHSTPVAYKKLIIYGTVQGRVIARSAKNGEEVIYNVDLGSPIETSGTIYKGKIFFQLRNHQIFCLDVETGKILWGFKKSISYLTTLQKSSSPIIYNNKLFVGFADGTLGAISIEEGILLYEVKLSQASKFLDVDSTPFAFDDKIYVGAQGSNVAIIEPVTGKIIRRADFSSMRSPILFQDQLVFGTSTGDLVFCDKNLVVLKNIKVSNMALTSLGIFKGKIVAGNLKGEVFAIDTNKFKIVEKFEFGHAYSAIFSDFAIKEDHLLVLSSRNRLFTFY